MRYLGSKISRAAGRVIENPFVSVTTDVPMKCEYRVAGPAVATGKNGNDKRAGNHSLPRNVSPKRLGMGVPGTTFPSTSFLSIDAVGSKIWAALHGHIDCGTHQRTPMNSSIKLLNVSCFRFRQSV